MRGLRPGRLALILAGLLPVAQALAQSAPSRREEPAGWPLRPNRQTLPVPMPVEPARRPPSPDERSGAPEHAGPATTAASGDTLPDNEIAPLDRFLLPIRPLFFTFDDARTALTREETAQLSRLAQRLRGTDDRLAITARSDASGRTTREALELSLARALAVRGFLIREGVPVAQIDITALPFDEDARVAGSGSVRIEQAPTGTLSERSQD